MKRFKKSAKNDKQSKSQKSKQPIKSSNSKAKVKSNSVSLRKNAPSKPVRKPTVAKAKRRKFSTKTTDTGTVGNGSAAGSKRGRKPSTVQRNEPTSNKAKLVKKPKRNKELDNLQINFNFETLAIPGTSRKTINSAYSSIANNIKLVSRKKVKQEDDSKEEAGQTSERKKTNVNKKTAKKVDSKDKKVKKEEVGDVSKRKASEIKVTKATTKTRSKNSQASNNSSGSRNKSTIYKRGHRVASLNAIAKVKLICENDRDNVNSTSTDKVESSSSASESSRSPKSKKKVCTELVKFVPSKTKHEEKKKTKRKKMKRRRRISIDSDVELIDTKRCKRMASLNASAMMAATYLPETRLERRITSPPVRRMDPLSSVCDTIDDVVRQWSVEHIERSVDMSKTTVKTTVKHVKLSGNNTVVETISTEYEQQNITQSSPKKQSKGSKQKTQPSTQDANGLNQFSSSPSAFTPCSSVHSTSLETIMSQQQSHHHHPFTSTNPFNVNSFTTNSTGSESARKKSRRKTPETTSFTQSKNKNPRSFIRKYEVKTIQTRLESVNQSADTASAHNTNLSNRFIFTNPAPSSILGFNPNHAPLPMSYNLPAFQFIPIAPTLANPSTASAPAAAAPSFISGESANPVNCISLANTTPIYYQPISNSYSMPNVSSIPVPFFQLANPPLAPYSYMEHRPAAPSNPFLYNLSPNPPPPTSTLYQSSNPVINFLPQDPSTCTFIHRPVACHPPPSGQNNTTTNLPPVNPMGTTTQANQGSSLGNSGGLFHYPLLRPPQMTPVRVPFAPYPQPTLLFQSPMPNSHTHPTVTPLTTIITPSEPQAPPPQSYVPKTTVVEVNSIGQNGGADVTDAGRMGKNVYNTNLSIDTMATDNGNTNSSSNSAQSVASNADIAESNIHHHHRQEQHSDSNGHHPMHKKKKLSEAMKKGVAKKKFLPIRTTVMQVPNGIMAKTSLDNGSAGLKKKKKSSPPITTTIQQNGSRNMLLLRNNRNQLKKVSPQNQRSPPVHTNHEVANIFDNSKLLSINNGLKKKNRPINHGWSWEGQAFECQVFLNVRWCFLFFFRLN